MFIYVRIPLVRDSFITCVVSLFKNKKKIASENRSLSLHHYYYDPAIPHAQ